MRKHILYLSVILSLFISCDDEYFPEGFYSYQVEYMLTNDDVKTWFVEREVVNGEVQLIEQCGDSVRWQFEVISSDSISSYKLIFDEDCQFYDTIAIGGLRVSGGSDYFADTLYFDQPNGNTNEMMLDYVSPSRMTASYSESGNAFEVVLQSIETGFLARQVEKILAGSNSDGRFWKLQALSIDGVSSKLQSCQDTTLWKFQSSGQGIRLFSLEYADQNCSSLASEDYGVISISEDNGYFGESLTLDGDVIPLIDFTEFSMSRIKVAYTIQDTLEYRATYKPLD